MPAAGPAPVDTPTGDRPRVVTCNVISVDGRVTLAPGVQLLVGDERWTRIAGDSDLYEWVRAVHDPEVLLEGSGSFVPRDAPPISYPQGGPEEPRPHGHYLPAGVVGTPGRRWMVIVDGRGRVQLQFTEWPDPAWAGWHALVLTARSVAPAHQAWMRGASVPYLVAGDEHVDLGLALNLLAEELGVRTVVCTGGGLLTGALLRMGLIDEIDLEVLPAAIGGSGTPALFDGAPLGEGQLPTRLELVSHEVTDGGHLRLRYAVVEP